MEDKNFSFLGTGWSFPPEFSNEGKEVVVVSGAKDVQQSLEILFGTRLEERILQEDFGCSLQDFVFAEINAGTINQMISTIKEAVLYHEPRVEVNSVEIDTTQQLEGYLLIKLDYSIPASNTRFNMVYPFYLEEATG